MRSTNTITNSSSLDFDITTNGAASGHLFRSPERRASGDIVTVAYTYTSGRRQSLRTVYIPRTFTTTVDASPSS